MPRLSVCALVVVAGYASPVAAEGARYTRIQPRPPEVVLSERVMPLQPRATVATSASAPIPAPAPTLALGALVGLEMPLGPMRAEQEQILAQLIQHTPDSEREEKADYYFRLASFYADEVRRASAKAAELAARQANPGATGAADKARLQAEQAKTANHLKMNLLKAVKAFKGLTDNEAFRQYPKLDTALFAYGYTLQLGRYMKEARAVYDKLLKNHPTSPHVPWAHLAFGDYYYDAGQLADAEARFKHVLKFPKSSAYAYAMYKLGWIHYQLGRHQEALEMFAQVVSASRNDAKQRQLHEAARRDFVHPYAKIGKTDRAFDAFARLDAGAAPDLVLLLANAARDRGDIETAIGAYRQLLAKAPKDARACLWHYELAHTQLAASGVTVDAKVREIEALVTAHVRDRAAAAAGQGEPDAECRDNAMAMAGELAAAYHAEWSKTRNATTLGYAERLYTAYTSAFAGDEHGDQRIALAEVLWARAEAEPNAKLRKQRWTRAALAFAAVDSAPSTAPSHDDDAPAAKPDDAAPAAKADDAPAAKPDDGARERTRAAALAWLNALDFTAPTTANLRVARRAGRAPAAARMKGHDEAMIAALTAYLATSTPVEANASTRDERASAALALATTLRKLRRFDEATDVLDRFLADHATHASAEHAATLLLDSLAQARSPDLDIVVNGMLADRAFVAAKPQLLRTLIALRKRR